MKVCHRYRLRIAVMTLMISVGILFTHISLTNAQTSSVLNKPATGLGAVLQPSPSPVHRGTYKHYNHLSNFKVQSERQKHATTTCRL
jgi:hypothetical protein